MQSSVYHIPALLDACMAGLAVQPDGTYVDVTFGGGGHSRAILERLGDKGRLYAFDQDEDACVNRIEDNRFTFVRSNFRFLKNFMRYYDVDSIDGLLADLGVSFHHFDASERGFSFRFDGALDMRMNRRARTTAADIIESYTQEQLSDIFYLYGELRSARKIAGAVVSAKNRYDDPFGRGRVALYRQTAGEKRIGAVVSGIAHRGQSRDGSFASHAVVGM